MHLTESDMPPKVAVSRRNELDSSSHQPPVSIAPPPRGRRLVSRILWGLSVLNLLAVLAVLLLLRVISEDWWVTVALTYLPRVPYLVPSLVLVALCLMMRRRWLFAVNLFAALLVAGPIMGGRLGLSRFTAAPPTSPLVVLSCNVEGWDGDVEKLRAEFAAARPDIIVLQEAPTGLGPLADDYSTWNTVHFGPFTVTSKYPVEIVERFKSEAFGHYTSLLCRIDGPDGPFLLSNTHLMTIRFGLMHLKPDSIITEHGVDGLMSQQLLRPRESQETLEFLQGHTGELPLLTIGDFNTPSTSRLFQRVWGGMTSAFDTTGVGFGYTSPCDTGEHWPTNTPWLRIDHILCNKHWHVARCWIGASDGSDHRYIAAELRLQKSSSDD